MCFSSDAGGTAAGSTPGLLIDREGRIDPQAGRVYHMVYDSFVLGYECVVTIVITHDA